MNKALDIVSKFCCFILSGILFFIILFYLLLNISTKIINKTNITGIVSNLDIEMFVDKDEFNDIYAEHELNESDKQIVYGVVNSKDFKELLGKYLGNVTELVLYDKQNDKITKEEVINVVNDKIDYIANEYDLTLSDEEKKALMNSLDQEVNELAEDLSNEEEILKELTQEEINSVRFFFGKGLKTILTIVIAVIVVLIMIFRWSFYRFAIWTGIATIMSGIFFTGCVSVLSSLIQNEIGGQISIQIIDILEKNIFNLMSKSGIFVIVIGVVQVVYYYILKKGNEDAKV